MPEAESMLTTESLRLVYMTAPTPEEAMGIARALVEERLAACVNVLGGMTSVYRWDGAVQEDAEVALIAKTSEDRMAALVERVKALHSYQCPCVISWSANGGNQDFLGWIVASVGVYSEKVP